MRPVPRHPTAARDAARTRDAAVGRGGIWWRHAAVTGVLLVGIGLRVELALVNTAANDNHIEVVNLIADRGLDPHVDDCWQCCQAKLFHRTVAAAVVLFGIHDLRSRIRLAQLVNVGAGALTLGLLWLMALAVPASFPVRLAGFSLLALNPKLIGINAQATNDSFVSLFGTAAIYFLWRHLATSRGRYLAAATAALVLASVSKAQGLALFAMTATILLVRVPYGGPRWRGRAWALAGACGVYLATVPFLGPYYDHYRLKGSPLAWNTSGVPPPALFEKNEIRRPGVRSVAEAYFTFRLVDLLREPLTRERPMALHRTSLWSQLYARSQSAHFAYWPVAWRSDAPAVLATTRAALLLGLIPLSLFFAGAAVEAARLAAGLARRGPRWLAEDDRWALLALAGGMVFLVTLLSYCLRDYSSMKAIYAFPGLAAFLALFLVGAGRAERALRARPGARAALFGAQALLACVYVADVAELTLQLR